MSTNILATILAAEDLKAKSLGSSYFNRKKRYERQSDRRMIGRWIDRDIIMWICPCGKN